MFRWLKKKLCNHEFKPSDLTQTGIKEQEKPESSNYREWLAYYEGRDKHPSHTHRVWWPCHKCGKGFYAHCGLDIAPKNGFIVNENA